MRWAALALALSLCACVASSGVSAPGFRSPDIENVYISLSAPSLLFGAWRGAAVIIAPNIAVTNAHNANLLDPAQVLGKSETYDLLFFRPDRTATPLKFGKLSVGTKVIAYGEGLGGELRLAHGVVLNLNVVPVCPGCANQSAFTFAGDAGKGFSGGPVLDAETGDLLGIVFGYTDDGPRVIYAYDMRRVAAELALVEQRKTQGLPH